VSVRTPILTFRAIGVLRGIPGPGVPATAPRKNGELWLVADDDVAHRHSLDAVLRCGLRRVRLDEPFLFVRTNRNDDFVRRKRRKSVANGETDIRLTSRSIDGLARQLLGRAFGDPLRMTERFLVVGEPVERALPYNRHHDLDGFGVPNMPAQNVVGMFDGADDEDVPAHAWKRTAEDSPPHRAAQKTAPAELSAIDDETTVYCPECAKRCGFARLRPLSAIASFQSSSAPARDSFIRTRFHDR